jgi:hypothetical protein
MPEGKGRGCPTSPPGNPQACAAGDKRAGGLASNPPPAYGAAQTSANDDLSARAVEFFDLVTQVIDLQVIFEPLVLDRSGHLVVDPVALGARHSARHGPARPPRRRDQLARHAQPRRDPLPPHPRPCRCHPAMPVTAVAAFVVTTLVDSWLGLRVEFPQALVAAAHAADRVTALSMRIRRAVVRATGSRICRAGCATTGFGCRPWGSCSSS